MLRLSGVEAVVGYDRRAGRNKLWEPRALAEWGTATTLVHRTAVGALKHYCGSIYRLAHRYQLGPSELGYDKPEAAQHITMPVEGGDVLILATDGLVWTSLLPHSTQSLSARN